MCVYFCDSEGGVTLPQIVAHKPSEHSLTAHVGNSEHTYTLTQSISILMTHLKC